MTVKMAQEQGLVGTTKDELDKMRPGMNRIAYQADDGRRRVRIVAKHDAIINPRGTREVELYIPQEEVRGIGRGVPRSTSFAKLACTRVTRSARRARCSRCCRSTPSSRPHAPGQRDHAGRHRDLLKAPR
jgi:hypothetical protein